MLRIAIDVTPLLGERTGIGVAVGGLARELAGRRELALVGYGLTARGWWRLGSTVPPGVRRARAPMPAGALLAAWRRWDVPPLELWSGRVDVAHGTNFVVPPTLRARRVVSVWDLTPVRFPQTCTPTALRYPQLIRRAVERGAWVHTGARAIAEEIVEHFGVPHERVRVVPPGLDALQGATRTTPVHQERERPYVLGLGTTEPRKDFPGLIAAFESIAPAHPELQLWIAGPPGWAEHQVVEAIARAPHRDRIRRLGWVDDALSLIAGAAVFAYPSIYEGFGLPPLEAMALGVPVVATTTGAVPEVVGDAALLVDPGDPEALGAAIEIALTDQATRALLVEAGRARAESFSWAAAGDAMADLYRDVASG